MIVKITSNNEDEYHKGVQQGSESSL